MPHGIHTPGLWAYATPISGQAAQDIKATLSIQQTETQTPHRNTQRCYTIWWAYQGWLDGDVGQRALVGLFSAVWRLQPSVPWDVLVLVFWWGLSKGEGLTAVQGDGVFPGPVWRNVYAWVPSHCAQGHVACYGGARERSAQG